MDKPGTHILSLINSATLYITTTCWLEYVTWPWRKRYFIHCCTWIKERTLWQLGQAVGTAAGVAIQHGGDMVLQDILTIVDLQNAFIFSSICLYIGHQIRVCPCNIPDLRTVSRTKQGLFFGPVAQLMVPLTVSFPVPLVLPRISGPTAVCAVRD